MKKLFNYNFVLVVVFMVALSACTDDCDYTPAPLPIDNNSGVSFKSSASNDIELAPTDTKELKLTLNRKTASSEQVVLLKVMRNDGNIFQIPASVTFAAGAQEAVATLTFPNAEIGVQYKYEIVLDNAGAYANDIVANASGSIQCVQWDNIGKGSFATTLFGNADGSPDVFQVEVYKASHADWYKLYSLYEENKDIVFVVNGSKVAVAKQVAFTHATYGAASIEGSGALKDGTVTVSVECTVSAGSFGFYQEMLKLPVK